MFPISISDSNSRFRDFTIPQFRDSAILRFRDSAIPGFRLRDFAISISQFCDSRFRVCNATGVCVSLICSRIKSRTVANNSRTVREQVFASSPRTTRLFATSVSSRINSRTVANNPSLLCLGIFTKLAYFGGSFETYHVF